jgi:3-hydroxyisobutyrate dehydrogenase-like beta-hydroxyacid dehydrogenase
MTERRQVRLGLIGFGEVGFNIAKGLRGEGLASITAFDTARGGGHDRVAARAQDAGVTLASSMADLAARSEVIVGVTPGGDSVGAAAALAEQAGPGHSYIDLASAAPRVKTEVADALAGSGVQFADGSIMGAPLIDGHRVEILASGPPAAALCAALVPWGMNITAVSDRIGAASAIKIFRSVIAKGLEAALVECLLATEQYGITDAVLASYTRFLAPQPFSEMASFLVRTDVIHAARRAEEAAMSAEALLDAGVEPIMTRATMARLGGVAALGLREKLGGQVPASYAEAIAAIAAGLRG